MVSTQGSVLTVIQGEQEGPAGVGWKSVCARVPWLAQFAEGASWGGSCNASNVPPFLEGTCVLQFNPGGRIEVVSSTLRRGSDMGQCAGTPQPVLPSEPTRGILAFSLLCSIRHWNWHINGGLHYDAGWLHTWLYPYFYSSVQFTTWCHIIYFH